MQGATATEQRGYPSVTEFTLLSVKPPPNNPEAKVGFLGLEKQQKSQTSKKGLPEGTPKAELSGRGETDIKQQRAAKAALC